MRFIAVALTVILILPVSIICAQDPVLSEFHACNLLTPSLLSMAEPGDAPPVPDDADSSGAELFGDCRWYFESYGSVATLDNSGNIYGLSSGAGFFFHDQLSFSMLGIMGYNAVRDDDRNSGYIGFDLVPRWHYLHLDRLRCYLEGGAGLQYAIPRSFPGGGSHFNFRLQAGTGAMYRITNDLHLLGGARYMHISNGNLADPNMGWDGVVGYLGILIAL